MQKRIELKIYGEVQGVFFRDSTRSKARELKLVGYVRNKLDGTVEIVAEGEDAVLRELIKWCEEHPGYSNVEKVETIWAQPTGEFDSFIVR